MEHWIAEESIVSVVSVDSHWLQVIAKICHARIYRDEGSSAVAEIRRGAIFCVRDAVIIKHDQWLLRHIFDQLKMS